MTATYGEHFKTCANSNGIISSYFNEQEIKYDAKHQAPSAYLVAPISTKCFGKSSPKTKSQYLRIIPETFGRLGGRK